MELTDPQEDGQLIDPSEPQDQQNEQNFDVVGLTANSLTSSKLVGLPTVPDPKR